MNNEFKKIKDNNETRYVLESTTTGATGAGAIATAEKDLGEVQKRNPDAPKPRNFVAKNAKMGGAGAHKDKKKAQKQGDAKHKKPFAETVETLKDRLSELKSKLSENNDLAQQMMALARSKGMNPRLAGTPEQEKQRTADMMAQRAKEREQQAQQAAQADAANLPALKAEYEEMRAKYKSLGGSNWQYADREQNLTASEREARSMEGPMNNLWRKIQAAEKSQGVAEGAEFGAYYYEKVAKEIFDKRQDITSEDEVLNQAYHIVSNEQGQKSARYMFNYDEDFPSDVVSTYFWLQKHQGVAEASPDTTLNLLKGLKSWQVVIMNNYYRGKYSDYSGRYYYVIASSPEEARQVVLDNADAILQELLAMKSVNGKKILPRSSAIPITDKRIGDIKDGTEAGRMSTANYKRMFGPQGPMMVKLSGGAIVDVQGQEQGVAEGASDVIGNAIEDLRVSKPGLDIESFLDELYFYLDAEWGKQAADQVANADEATQQEWYANYNDMTEDAVADFLAKGGQIQHGKLHKPRKAEKWQGSSHIGTGRGGKAQNASGMGANTNKGGNKPVVSTEELGYDTLDADSARKVLRMMDRDADLLSIFSEFPEVSRMYDNIAGEMRLHPDDDADEIQGILYDELSDLAQSDRYNEAAPKGWEGTVKAMKKHKDIDNPWALAHYMKNKGYKSHKEDAYMESLFKQLEERAKK